MNNNQTYHHERISDSASIPVISYQINNSLYLNLTQDCPNHCYYCLRFRTDVFRGYNLHIETLPNASELINKINYPRKYREIVFRGYGEPTMRLGVLKQVAKWIKENNGLTRLITNGQGNLIHRRNIVPELVGLIGSLTITLNAHNAAVYQQVCNPDYGELAFHEILSFIRESIKYIPKVEVVTLNIPEVDINQCTDLAVGAGAQFRLKYFKAI